MKALVIFTILATCVYGNAVPNVVQKLIPSFARDFVIKGEDAVPHSAPYIVSLSKSTKHFHFCGGTIIAKVWVLTAAHCINKDPVNIHVLAGLHSQLNIDNKTQDRIVDWGRVHEKYTGGVGPYDIAILHVSEPFKFNQYVQAAFLPAIEEIHSGKTNLYGWGQQKPFVFTGAKTLQTVETEILEYNACKEALPANSPIHETNICSDSMKKNISACNGDSGGPLVIQRVGTPSELIGIVSWGYIPCGKANMPSIYTRLSAHIKWITKIQNAFYVLY